MDGDESGVRWRPPSCFIALPGSARCWRGRRDRRDRRITSTTSRISARNAAHIVAASGSRSGRRAARPKRTSSASRICWRGAISRTKRIAAASEDQRALNLRPFQMFHLTSTGQRITPSSFSGLQRQSEMRRSRDFVRTGTGSGSGACSRLDTSLVSVVRRMSRTSIGS